MMNLMKRNRLLGVKAFFSIFMLFIVSQLAHSVTPVENYSREELPYVNFSATDLNAYCTTVGSTNGESKIVKLAEDYIKKYKLTDGDFKQEYIFTFSCNGINGFIYALDKNVQAFYNLVDYGVNVNKVIRLRAIEDAGVYKRLEGDGWSGTALDYVLRKIEVYRDLDDREKRKWWTIISWKLKKKGAKTCAELGGQCKC